MKSMIAVVAVGCLLLGAACGGSSGGGNGDGNSSAAKPYVDALIDDMTHPDDDAGEVALSEQEANCFAPKVIDVFGMDAIERSKATPAEFADAADDAKKLSELDIEVGDDAGDQVADAMTACLDDAFFAKLFAEQFGYDELPEACEDFFNTENWAPVAAASFVSDGDGDGDEAIGDLMAEAPGACAERLLLDSIAHGGDITAEQAACIGDALDDGDAAAIWQATIANGEDWTDDNAELAGRLQAAFASCA
jgi:hypothetical protein